MVTTGLLLMVSAAQNLILAFHPTTAMLAVAATGSGFAFALGSVVWDTVLEEVAGEENPLKVKRAILRNVNTGALTERTVDGIFIAIGHTPASELFVGQLDMKPSGYIKTAPFSTATSVPGVFAAGDVTDDVYRQAVTAAGQGCMAALEAEKFLAAHGEAEPRVAAE